MAIANVTVSTTLSNITVSNTPSNVSVSSDDSNITVQNSSSNISVINTPSNVTFSAVVSDIQLIRSAFNDGLGIEIDRANGNINQKLNSDLQVVSSVDGNVVSVYGTAKAQTHVDDEPASVPGGMTSRTTNAFVMTNSVGNANVDNGNIIFSGNGSGLHFRPLTESNIQGKFNFIREPGTQHNSEIRIGKHVQPPLYDFGFGDDFGMSIPGAQLKNGSERYGPGNVAMAIDGGNVVLHDAQLQITGSGLIDTPNVSTNVMSAVSYFSNAHSGNIELFANTTVKSTGGAKNFVIEQGNANIAGSGTPGLNQGGNVHAKNIILSQTTMANGSLRAGNVHANVVHANYYYGDASNLTGIAGDIESVTAGSGLTGGGTSGDVTLNVGAGYGLTVNADSIEITNAQIQAQANVALGNNTTDALSEGSTNQYYTDTRSRSAVSVTQDTASGAGTLAYNNSSGVFTYTPPDLTAFGLTNAQVISHIATVPLAVGGNLSVTGNINATGNINTQNQTDLYVKDTKITMNANAAADATVELIANRPESTYDAKIVWNEPSETWTFMNGDNTFQDMLTTTQTKALLSVGTPATPSGNGSLAYNSTSGEFTLTPADTSLATKTTTNLTEGTNLYYTNARADARVNLQTGTNLDLSNKSTSDLSEGTNQYYTDTRSRGAVSVTQASASGTGALAYDNGTGVFTYTPPDLTGTSLTNAQAQSFIESSGLTMTADITSDSLIKTTGNLQVNADTDVSGLSGLTFDSATNNLGLGTPTPKAALHIRGTSNESQIYMTEYNGTSSAGIDLRTFRAGGTEASPTVTPKSDRIWESLHYAYDGTGTSGDGISTGFQTAFAQQIITDPSIDHASEVVPVFNQYYTYLDGDATASNPHALMRMRSNGDIQFSIANAFDYTDPANAVIKNDGTITTTSGVTATGNVTGSYIKGNGSELTGILTTNVAEGTNQYYTDTRSRGALSTTSATASGGGALAYDNGTGVFTFTPAVPGIALTDLSTTSATASGGGALAYDNSSGVFTFTPSVPGIALTDLSVTQASASGSGALAYNNSSGVFTYTPPDLAGTGLSNAQAQAFIQSNGLSMTANIDSTNSMNFTYPDTIPTGLKFVSDTGSSGVSILDVTSARSGDGGPQNIYRKATGSIASPGALGTRDYVRREKFFGHDGTQYLETMGTMVYQDSDVGGVSTDIVPLAYEIYTEQGGDVNHGYNQSIVRFDADRNIIFNDTGTRTFGNGNGNANIKMDGSFNTVSSITAAGDITGANVTATATLETEMLNAGSYTMNTAIYGNSVTGNYDSIIVSAGNHEPNLNDGTPVVIADSDANNPFANGSIKADNTFYVRQVSSSSGYYFLYQQPDMGTISTSGGSYFNTTGTCTFTFPTLNVTANVTMGPDSAFRQGNAYAYNHTIGQSLFIGEIFNRNAQLDVSGDTTITNYSGNAALTLVNNINSATVPTQLVMKQNRNGGFAAGVAGDLLSVVKTQGMTANTSAGLKTYANVITSIVDATAGSEDANVDFKLLTAGTEASKLILTPTNVHIDTVKPITSLGDFTLQGNVVIDKADFTASGTATNAITAIISHGNQGGSTTADSIILTTELADGTAVAISGISSADDDSSGSYTEVNNGTFYTKQDSSLGFGVLGVGLFQIDGTTPIRLMTGSQFKGSPSGSPIATYAAGTFIDVKDANLEVKGHTTANTLTTTGNLLVEHNSTNFTRVFNTGLDANVDIFTAGKPTINLCRGQEGVNNPTFLRTSSLGPTSGTAGSYLETNAGTLALNSPGSNVLASIGVFTNGTTVQLGHDGASDEWRLQTVADTNYYRITTTDDFGRLDTLTTTQINALSSPATGQMVFNTTLGQVCVYDSSAWQKLTQSAM